MIPTSPGGRNPCWQERPVAYVEARPDLKGTVGSEEILEYLRPKVAN